MREGKEEGKEGVSVPPRIRVISDEEAAEHFRALVGCSSEYEVVREQLERLMMRFPAERSVKVLDVGAGFGFGCTLECLSSEGRVAHYCAIEPNKAMHDDLIARGEELCNGAGSEGETSFSMRAELFTQHTELPMKDFDLIIFCHSLYAAGSKAAFLVANVVVNHMASDGICVIFHRASACHLFAQELSKEGQDNTLMETAVFPCTITVPREKQEVEDAVLSAYYGTDMRQHIQEEKEAIRKRFLLIDIAGQAVIDATMAMLVIAKKKL